MKNCVEISEALNWLKNANNHHAFAGNRFDDNEDAANFVKELYEAGAVKVEIEIDDWERDEDYADTLYITLPEDLRKRLDIVPVVFDRRPDEFDYDWNSDEPIRLWWD